MLTVNSLLPPPNHSARMVYAPVNAVCLSRCEEHQVGSALSSCTPDTCCRLACLVHSPWCALVAALPPDEIMSESPTDSLTYNHPNPPLLLHILTRSDVILASIWASYSPVMSSTPLSSYQISICRVTSLGLLTVQSCKLVCIASKHKSTNTLASSSVSLAILASH